MSKYNYENLSKEELIEEIKKLKSRKKYGLVWEDHPEDINENAFPMLEEVEDRRIVEGGEENLLIEGDNYHSLRSLLYTHKGKIDVIYIDPPYNTGNKDFVYNDKMIGDDDIYRHSKWLSFMEKRLRLARELMSDDSVIFISIDDNEMAQLKLLCDGVFGENNFITIFLWKQTNTPPSLAKMVRNNMEYILAYRKSNVRNTLFGRNSMNNDSPLANSSNSIKTLEIPVGTCIFPNLTKGSIEEGIKGSGVELLDEIQVFKNTNKNPFKVNFHSKWGQLNLENEITKGTYLLVKNIEFFSIRYQKKKNTYIAPDKYLDASKFEVGTNENGRQQLIDVLGNNIVTMFDYPKNTPLIKTLLNAVSKYNKEATVLDFFAGSGTTGQALLELNKEDEGNRKFILCTNNENNISEEVTYERIKRVINGYTTPKGKDVEGLPGSLRYYKTKEVGDIKNPTRKDIDEVISHLETLLKIKHGTYQNIEVDQEFNLYENDKEVLVYLKNIYETNRVIEELKKVDKEKHIYIISHDEETMEKIKEKLESELSDLIFHQIPKEFIKFFKNIEQNKK